MGERHASLISETGKRVVVRYRLPDGRATDVLGEVVAGSNEVLTVLPDYAGPVSISASQVIAVKDVPQRVVRPASPIAAISRVLQHGWPGLERARLGGWIVMASGGFTSRANCCLPVGDPGVPTDEALDVVEEFFAVRGLPAKVQVSSPAPGSGRDDPSPGLAALLEARGYVPDLPTLVMLRELTADDSTPAPKAVGPQRLRWADQPDENWLGLYRYRGDALPDDARQVLMAAREQRFATVHDPGGRAIACARLALHDGWAGVTAMQVEQQYRRQGLARWLLQGLLARAAQEQARQAYLQVSSDNHPAIDLYESMGFETHYTYRYWTR